MGMSHTVVTYTARPDRAHENAALIKAVFAELAERQPEGFSYTVFHLPDSGRFIHIHTAARSDAVSLQSFDSFQAFVEGAADRHAEPAAFSTAELIGDYR
jgi:hypothetical protein